MNSFKLETATLSRRFLRNILLAVVAVAAFAQTGRAETLTPEEAKVLEARVKSSGDAFRKEDYEAVVDMMHPAAFTMGANKEQMLTLMKDALVKLKAMDFAVIEEQYGEPGEVYTAGDEMVCFYPRTMVMKFGEKKAKAIGFIICAKKRSGGEWLLMDGNIVSKDPTILWKVLPSLPKDVKLPEVKIDPDI
jgi:hypothetical protein